MKWTTALGLVLLAALGLSQSVVPRPTHTIAQIFANPVYDQRVVVRAAVVRQTDRGEYLLRDATGQIEAGSAGRTRLSLPVGQTLTLEAEVDFNQRGQAELDVLRYWLPSGRVVVIPVAPDQR
jgi:uncharacterized protein YdeI (BOF family)